MKSSWWLGIFMGYIVVLVVETLATGGSIYSSNLQWISEWTRNIPIVGGMLAIIGSVTSVFLLWSPTIFASDWMLLVWWMFCFPLDVMMVVGVLIIIRGGSSS